MSYIKEAGLHKVNGYTEGESKHAYIKSREYGWNFDRVVYEDNDGYMYVKIQGDFIPMEWVLERADEVFYF